MPTRLLLIDDEPSGLLALLEALRQRLHETVIDTAVSAHTALSLLRDNNYHGVLSDIRMAGMDGLTLLNQIRERWPDTPVILMTAAGYDREPEALYNGAFSFVEKPIDLDRLVAVLRAAMAKSELQQRVREANRVSVLNRDSDTPRSGRDVDPSKRPLPE